MNRYCHYRVLYLPKPETELLRVIWFPHMQASVIWQKQRARSRGFFFWWGPHFQLIVDACVCPSGHCQPQPWSSGRIRILVVTRPGLQNGTHGSWVSQRPRCLFLAFRFQISSGIGFPASPAALFKLFNVRTISVVCLLACSLSHSCVRDICTRG